MKAGYPGWAGADSVSGRGSTGSRGVERRGIEHISPLLERLLQESAETSSREEEAISGVPRPVRHCLVNLILICYFWVAMSCVASAAMSHVTVRGFHAVRGMG